MVESNLFEVVVFLYFGTSWIIAGTLSFIRVLLTDIPCYLYQSLIYTMLSWNPGTTPHYHTSTIISLLSILNLNAAN